MREPKNQSPNVIPFRADPDAPRVTWYMRWLTALDSADSVGEREASEALARIGIYVRASRDWRPGGRL